MYSREILEAVFTCQELRRPLKLMLLYFARYAQPDGSEIWPGEETAAHDLCCTTRTIRRDTKRLIDDEWLLPDGKKGYTNRYKVNRVKLGLPEKPPTPKPRKAETEKPPAQEDGQNEHESTGQTGQENGAKPVDPMQRFMERTAQRLGSYSRMKRSKNPDAHLWEPEQEDVAAFLREYRAMQNRLDDNTKLYEFAANFAESILLEKGVLR